MNWNPPEFVRLIICEGNIGAGKTSALESLIRSHHSAYTLEVIPEGLFNFTRFGNFNPLALSYESPEENFSVCQLHVIRTINTIFRRYIEHLQTKYRGDAAPTREKPLFIISDRSLFAPLVFLSNARANGIISEFVFSYLHFECWTAASESYRWSNLYVRGIFFVDTSLEECKRRIMQRGRSFERNLNDSLLNGLQAQYLDHLSWWRQNPAVMLRVSPGKNKKVVVNDLKSMLDDIIQEDRLY